MNLEKLIPASWRTTAFGVIAGLTVILTQVGYFFDGKEETVADWNKIVEGLGLVGIGLMARDKNVTSEQEGLK